MAVLFDQISEMEKVWNEKTIKLHQTPLDQYPFAMPARSMYKRKTTITFAFQDGQPRPSSKTVESTQTQEHLYSVRDGGKLLKDMISAGLQLKLVHSSQYLGQLKNRVESLQSSLGQTRETFSLLMQCQEQVRSTCTCIYLYFKPQRCLQSPDSLYKPYLVSDTCSYRFGSLFAVERSTGPLCINGSLLSCHQWNL